MKRIGLFGGMFDPVHLGHLHAAEKVADAMCLDSVIFIPANVPPHKLIGCYADGEHRLNMLRLAIEADPRFSVSDFELSRKDTSYSYITVEHFRKAYPLDKLYFIIGDEAYNLLHTWRYPERIRRAAEFVVVTRDGSRPPQDVHYVRIPKVQISSTEVRDTLQNGENAARLLLPEVLDYIEKNGLYRGTL